jgi:Putative Ig domain
MMTRTSIWGVLWFVLIAGTVNLELARAQQASDPSQLAVDAIDLPKATPHHPYRFQFQAHGGIPPLTWTLMAGSLPTGMKLGSDGTMAGTPGSVGNFRFTVSVSDSSRPVQTARREFVLHVVPPLLLEWKREAKVSGNRIDGSVQVSNGTEDDFDLTFIVLAVAENGRAVAIGYQRFPLKTGTTGFEIPFGDTLPNGSYVVHLDVVAEVAAKDLIYRARLQTKDRLAVVVGP